MKSFVIVLLMLISTGNVYTQKYLEIRKKIVPLHTTRSAVEKLTRFVKDFTIFVRYETDNEFIDVFYSQERCVGHGWNIPKDTVLTFNSYPKREIELKEMLTTNRTLVSITDDILSSYYVNQQEGINFVARNNERNIEYIGFSPAEADSNLRCKGFPKFNLASEHYSPYQTFSIRDTSDWDVGLIYDSISQVKTDQKGFIFIYCKKEELVECKKLKKSIEDFIYSELKEKPQKISVILGGLRDGNEVETFIILKKNPAPIARPTLPLTDGK